MQPQFALLTQSNMYPAFLPPGDGVRMPGIVCRPFKISVRKAWAANRRKGAQCYISLFLSINMPYGTAIDHRYSCPVEKSEDQRNL